MKLLSIMRMMINAFSKPKQGIILPSLPEGCVLDIGGGGEGIIAQYGGSKVVVIDKLRSEIKEAFNNAPYAIWLIGDGTRLPMLSESYETATAFFSCMYMDDQTKHEVFAETYRTLKPGGEFWIWDGEMTVMSDVFAIRLSVDIGETKVSTIYGARTKNQSVETMCQSLNTIGFNTEVHEHHKHWFFIKAKKPSGF